MATDVSNIDELLSSGKTATQPETPEHQYEDDWPEINDHVGNEESTKPNTSDDILKNSHTNDYEEDAAEEIEPEKEVAQQDDYGNEKEPENEVIRERLARQARKHEAELNALRAQLAQQGASQQVQQAAKNFEYDPDENGDWQQQLAQFVKQTVNSMTHEQEQARIRNEEVQVQQEFESKLREGMGRFNDFVDVVSAQPVTYAMTHAMRGIGDPAAFIYAASKRHPEELMRISNLRDPVAQVVEMGKLEERMRRKAPGTQAPKPVSRTQEDSTYKEKPKPEVDSIEKLIAQSEARKRAQLKLRRGR